MQVTITKGLLSAVERAADDAKSRAYDLRNSKEYEECLGNVKLFCARSIEQGLQDYDVLMNWSKRVREEHNIRD